MGNRGDLVDKAISAAEAWMARREASLTDAAAHLGVNVGLMSILMRQRKLRPTVAKAMHRAGWVVLPPEPIKMSPATAAVILAAMEPRKLPRRRKRAVKKTARAPRFSAAKNDPVRAATAVVKHMEPGDALALAKMVEVMLGICPNCEGHLSETSRGLSCDSCGYGVIDGKLVRKETGRNS
jgi:hypothetical protein